MKKLKVPAYIISAAAILGTAISLTAFAAQGQQQNGNGTQPGFPAGQEYTTSWRFVGHPGYGARFFPDQWFQVLPDESLYEAAYEEAAQRWYYSDGGELCADGFRTINGATYYFDRSGRMSQSKFELINDKLYAFDQDGRMVTGLRLMLLSPNNRHEIIEIIDPSLYLEPYKYVEQYRSLIARYNADSGTETPQVASFYFNSEGVMQTGEVEIDLDGDNSKFYFADSGPEKGQGFTSDPASDNYLYLGGLMIQSNPSQGLEIGVFFKNGYFQNYTMSEFLSVIGLSKSDGNPDYYNKNKDGSFKDLIEKSLGEIDSYGIFNDRGSFFVTGTREDGDYIRVVIEKREITRIYK